MPATATPPAPARAKSTTNGKGQPANIAAAMPYYFEVVPIRHMIVDEYQRPLTSLKDDIVKEYIPALVGTVCLSKRSRTQYALIDGQTRTEAMKELGLKDAPSIVYEGLSREQEAALFHMFQTRRRRMHSADIFKARVFAGEPQAVGVNEVLVETGFNVDQNIASSGKTMNMGIAATGALEFVYLGCVGPRTRNVEPKPELLRQTLEVIKKAWPDIPDTAKSAVLIKGLGYYLSREPESGKTAWRSRTTDVQEDRLTTRLSKVTPSALAKRAESLRDGRGMSGNSPAYMAEAIESQYRKSR